MDAIKFNTVVLCRSYGVVLWEITSYGDAPLDDMEAKDIVEAAQDGTLQHSRSIRLEPIMLIKLPIILFFCSQCFNPLFL